MDSTLFRYSHRFYPSPVLARILPFSGTCLDSTFPGPFFDTRTDFTLCRYSLKIYPSLVLIRTVCRYSPGFYHSPVLARIQPFLELVCTLFRYSHGFYPCLVLAWMLPFSGTRLDTTFPYTRSDHFSILARILPFFGTPYFASNVEDGKAKRIFSLLKSLTWKRKDILPLQTSLLQLFLHVMDFKIFQD